MQSTGPRTQRLNPMAFYEELKARHQTSPLWSLICAVEDDPIAIKKGEPVVLERQRRRDEKVQAEWVVGNQRRWLGTSPREAREQFERAFAQWETDHAAWARNKIDQAPYEPAQPTGRSMPGFLTPEHAQLAGRIGALIVVLRLDSFCGPNPNNPAYQKISDAFQAGQPRTLATIEAVWNAEHGGLATPAATSPAPAADVALKASPRTKTISVGISLVPDDGRGQARRFANLAHALENSGYALIKKGDEDGRIIGRLEHPAGTMIATCFLGPDNKLILFQLSNSEAEVPAARDAVMAGAKQIVEVINWNWSLKSRTTYRGDDIRYGLAKNPRVRGPGLSWGHGSIWVDDMK